MSYSWLGKVLGGKRVWCSLMGAAGGLALAAVLAGAETATLPGEVVDLTFPPVEGRSGMLAERVARWEEGGARGESGVAASVCSVRWDFDSKEDLRDWAPVAEPAQGNAPRSFLERIKALLRRLRGGQPRIRGGVLKFPSQPVVCLADLGFRTSQVREVVLRMRADAGSTFRLWYGDRAAPTHRFRVIEGDLVADGQFHTYRLLVQGFSEWAEDDPLTRLTLLPSDVPGALVEVDSVCLVTEEDSYRARRVGVERVRLGRVDRVWGKDERVYDEYSGRHYKKSGYANSEERRAVFAQTPAVLRFPLTIPDGALLRMGCALLKPDEGGEFKIAVADGDQMTLIHTCPAPPDRCWTDVEADLAPFAGREVTLILKARAPAGSNVAFWGHPRVRGAAEDGARLNVLIYLLDAVNPDHLGIYGAERSTSPTIDRLAREGVFFRQCFAPSSWTKTSVVSLFTSLYPEAHGVTTYASRLGPSQPTLTDLMRRGGYTTASFLTNPHAGSGANLDRGFDYLFSVDTTLGLNERILAWLAAQAAEPFFIYAHAVETHMPYIPPAPYDTMFAVGSAPDETAPLAQKVEHAKGLYDGALRYNDALLGELLEGIGRLGLADRTLVVITADHGEAFFAHGGLYGHQSSVYNDQIRVPLVLWLPGHIPAGRAVDVPVSLVDILPTVSELLRLKYWGDTEGASLLALLEEGGSFPRRKVYSQETTGFVSGTTYACVIDGRWKCILDRGSGRVELYNLEVDPDEQEDLAFAHPEQAEAYRQHLMGWLQAEQKIARRWGSGEILVSPEERERLRGLGYLD